jgi:hypothetical protein
MGDYFKPPQRKLGVVILAMACGVLGLWSLFRSESNDPRGEAAEMLFLIAFPLAVVSALCMFSKP